MRPCRTAFTERHYRSNHMSECSHRVLVLCKTDRVKLRCRHCHLTISPEELAEGPCPECLEAFGVHRRDFEEAETGDAGKVRYQCEECGLIIDVP